MAAEDLAKLFTRLLSSQVPNIVRGVLNGLLNRYGDLYRRGAVSPQQINAIADLLEMAAKELRKIPYAKPDIRLIGEGEEEDEEEGQGA